MVFKIKTLIDKSDRINVTHDFIKNNRLSLNRSQEEILNFLKGKDTFFNNEIEVLHHYLNFENAKQFYKEETVKRIENGEIPEPLTISSIEECSQDFLDYMVFAWGKSQEERAISASRSINKLSAWLWLMGREDLYIIINSDVLYNPYGSPALIEICKNLSIKVPQSLINFSLVKC